MSNLSVFVFESQEVRFVGTPEKPEWIAADVCTCLEIRASGVSEALASLEDDEKGNDISVTLGGEQEIVGAIGETIATPERHVSPTTIGELYAKRQGLSKPIKPHIVNRVLEEAGLQYKEVEFKTDSTGKQSHKNI